MRPFSSLDFCYGVVVFAFRSMKVRFQSFEKCIGPFLFPSLARLSVSPFTSLPLPPSMQMKTNAAETRERGKGGREGKCKKGFVA